MATQDERFFAWSPCLGVHSPSRLTLGARISASPNASITNANFSAFEMLIRRSQARAPSDTARVATSP